MNWKEILRTVAAYYEVSQGDLLGPRRWPHLSRCRNVAIYVTRQIFKMSTPELGKLYGGRHHTTILHGLKNVEASPELLFDAQAIIRILGLDAKSEGATDVAGCVSSGATPRRYSH